MYSMLLATLPKFSLNLLQVKYFKEFSIILVALNYPLLNFDFMLIRNFLWVQGRKSITMEPTSFMEVLD